MTVNRAQAPTATAYEPWTPGPQHDPAPAPGTDDSPSVARRLAERFALIAFGLYHIPLFLNNYPSLGGGGFNDTGLAPRFGHIFTPAGVWVARHVLHLAAQSPSNYQGDNGDVSEEFGRLLLCVAIGVIGAVAWSLADRRRPRGQWVESTLRVLLRYSIALGLMSYAVAKLLPQQFPPIAPGTLEARVGDLSPMALLWTFMQYSRAYAFFGGVMELVACVLLCVRRTATLGALICVGVMTNVTLLNYAYGVPVKLYATMITLSAVVLVLYDTRRLLDVFVRNRAVPAPRESTVLQDRVPSPWRRTIKIAAVGSVTLSSFVAMATLRPAAQSPVEGAWVVMSADSAARWSRLTVNAFGVSIRTRGDSTLRCGRAPGVDSTLLSLQCARGRRAELRWSRAQDTLRLDGTFDAEPVHVTAKYVDRSSYALLRSRFRWISE